MLDGGRRHWQGRLWVARSVSAQAGRANLRSNLGTTLQAPHPCRTRANFHNFALYSATAGGKLSSSAAVLNSCAGSPSFVSTCAATMLVATHELGPPPARCCCSAEDFGLTKDPPSLPRTSCAPSFSAHWQTDSTCVAGLSVQPTDQPRGHNPSGAQDWRCGPDGAPRSRHSA